MSNDEKAGLRKLSKMQKIALLAGTIVFMAIVTASLAYSLSSTVAIIDNGNRTDITTFANTVDALLKAENVTLGEKDEVIPSLDTTLENGTEITITRAKAITLEYGTESTELRTARLTVGEMLEQEGYVVEENDIMEPAEADVITEGMTVTVTKVTFETVVEQEQIPFGTTRRATSSLKENETKVVTEGVEGTKENTYTIKYVNGEQAEKELTNSATVKEPVTKVIEYGSKPPAASTAAAYTAGTKSLSSRGDVRYKKVINVTATAYELLFGSKNGKPGKTASGRTLSLGMIAVDPRVIPLGTRVYVESPDGKWVYGEAIAADTGGGIVGNRIDICLPTYNDCIQFGVRPMKVYILE